MSKITILTPSYNQAKFLLKNIESIQNQRNVIVEHIIIDGGSNDETIEIFKKYPHLKWISEKDEGQADALQKGLKMATGEIIGWINSDDYLEENILDKVSDLFKDFNVDWVIGNLVFTYEGDKKNRIDKSPKITTQNLSSNPDILRQPGTFFRKNKLEESGGFNKKYHLTMDLDLWFRMLKISEPLMVDQTFAYFRLHWEQKTSGKHVLLQMKEILDIFSRNNVSIFYCIKLIYRKLTFYVYLKFVRFVKKRGY